MACNGPLTKALVFVTPAVLASWQSSPVLRPRGHAGGWWPLSLDAGQRDALKVSDLSAVFPALSLVNARPPTVVETEES